MEAKVNVNLDGLKALATHAKTNGTITQWADIALEWMNAAQVEIYRLQTLLDKEGISYAPDD